MSDSEIGIKITAEASGVAPAASEATAQVVKLDSAVQDMAAQMKQAGQVTEQASQVVAVAMQSQVSAIDTATQAHRRMGVAGMEMMHVVRASSDAIAAGIPPFQVLTMEIGRIAEAAALSGGALGKVGAIFQGPFGIAAIAATVIVGKVIEKLVEQKTELEENAKALEKVKIGDAGLSDLQGQLAKMFDTATGKIKDQNKHLRANIEMQAIKTRTEAREKQEGANKQLNGIAPSWWSSPRSAAPQVRPLKEMLAQIDAGKMSVDEALHRAESMDFSKTNISRGDFQKAIHDRDDAAEAIKNANDAENSLRTGQLAGQFRTNPKKPRKERDSTVADLDAGLEAMKTAWAKQQDAQGTFQEFSLQQEEQYWSKQKERTDLSGAAKEQIEKKWLAARQALKREELAKALDGFKEELAAAGANMTERLGILDREHAYVVKMYGANSKEAAASEVEITKAKVESAKQRIAIAEEVAKAEQALALHNIEMAQSNAQFQVQMGNLTQQQLIELEKQFEDQRYNVQRQALEKKKELMAQDPSTDPVKYQQVLAQLAQLDQQHQLKGQENAQKNALAMKSIFDQTYQPFAQTLSKMLTLQQGFFTTWRGLWSNMTNVVQQAVAKQLTSLLTGLAQGEAAQKLNHMREVAMHAKTAAAAAYKAMAGIPVIGPVLGAAAAAATFAGVMAFSAKGGMDDVPYDNAPFLLHKNEMVLPADIATPLRNMTRGGGAQSGNPFAAPAAANDSGGDTHIHIHTTDPRSFARYLKDNAHHVAAAVNDAYRGGYRPK